MKISETTIKALKYIKKYPYSSAANFALHLWPDSNMHLKSSNQGHGATRGKAAWLCGGSYLGKLKKAGLVKLVLGGIGFRDRHVLTDAGEKAISDFLK